MQYESEEFHLKDACLEDAIWGSRDLSHAVGTRDHD